MSFDKRVVTVRHWLPIMTICPVNNLPDLIYISVEFTGADLHELYAVRRKIKELVSFRREFMEHLAQEVFDHFSDATGVTLRLAFNRHTIELKRVF